VYLPVVPRHHSLRRWSLHLRSRQRCRHRAGSCRGRCQRYVIDNYFILCYHSVFLFVIRASIYHRRVSD
jgi:hypothetical protein